MKTYFKHGSWNAVCDVCGFQFKAYQIKKRWDGLMVCSEDYETDHPQKYIRVQEDGKPTPWSRPEPTDSFVLVCDYVTKQGRADMGTADCAQADLVLSGATIT